MHSLTGIIVTCQEETIELIGNEITNRSAGCVCCTGVQRAAGICGRGGRRVFFSRADCLRT